MSMICFSPIVLPPSSEGVSVNYAATLKSHPYRLTEWEVESYVVAQEIGHHAAPEVRGFAENELADYIVQRQHLDEIEERERQERTERERQLLASQEATARQAQREDEQRRQMQASQSSGGVGKLVAGLLGGAAIVAAGVDAGADADVIGESLGQFVGSIMNDEPIAGGNLGEGVPSGGTGIPGESSGGFQVPSRAGGFSGGRCEIPTWPEVPR